MNVETTIAPCASGAWHGDSPARLRACISIAGVLCCAACLRVLAGVLDGADAGFEVAGRGDAPVSAESPGASASEGQSLPVDNVAADGPLHSDLDYGEAHSDTGHEVQA
jgi:hypothetical protein